MTLEECLQQLPWRTIAAIAQAQALPYTHRHDKPTICARLAAAIIEPERLPATWRALSPEAQAALRALIEADGQMRREVFTARFGSIRPYKPWREETPPAPWENPASPAEELAYRGLVFAINQGTKRRPLWAVVLPDEIKAAVSPFLEGAMSAAPALAPPPAALRAEPFVSLRTGPRDEAPPADIGAAVLTFLCFLNREDIRPIHGRWLPPIACRTLQGATHLGSASHLTGRVRSERQLPYLSFVHYLAERAGLVDVEGIRLKPTLLAQTWLAQPRAERLRALWEAWREDEKTNTELWSRFHLPGDSDLSPLTRFNCLLSLLAFLTPGDYPLDDLLDALAQRDPALLQSCAPYRTWAEMDEDTQADFRQRARLWVTEMLTGPLAWFGATALLHSPSSILHSPSSPIWFTPLGAALLGREDGAWPADPPSSPLHLYPPTLDGEGKPIAVPLTVPAGLSPASRLALAALTEEDDDQTARLAPAGFVIQPSARRIANPAGAETILVQTITPRSVARALRRGHTVEGLVTFLEELTNEPLSPSVLKTLYTWAEAVEAITIAPALLLRVRDPALLQELASIRRLRARLGETLSARAVTVEADQLEALVRHLERLGFYCDGGLRMADCGLGPGGRPTTPAAEGDLSKGERTAIAAALRLFVALADELGLDLRPPHLLAQRWLESLPQAQRDAAHRQVQTVLEALRHRDARQGVEDYRLPSPTAPLLPELEQAIAQGATIEMDYYTAGRQHLLSRRADPLRLEWRGGVPYLVAFCHLRQEPRTFRVDRIERVESGEGREWRMESGEGGE